MLNLSSLFFTSDDNEACLFNALELTPRVRAELSLARTKVRNCLRHGIPRVLKERGYTDEAPEPRFFTQGSWAYKTLNGPCQHPQQADLDDGCYLPLGFVSQTTRPSVAATVFFEAAEAALKPLCEAEGWPMSEKPTCIRIEVSADAHIDVPLYAIPDKEFKTLAKALLAGYQNFAMDEAIRKAEHDVWSKLPSNEVLLAHRVHGWWESDPRPVKEWFEGQVAVRGEQLRRVVRYLKAFRDWKWPNGGPASILLMAAAAPLFERRDRRDDLALLDVVAKIGASLRAGVCNPANKGESLTERLGKEGIEEAAAEFDTLEKDLRGAVNAGNESQACVWVQRNFGHRFPYRPDRIKVVSVAATIAAAPAVAGPSELVGRSKAG